jgi:hypothetical protein
MKKIISKVLAGSIFISAMGYLIFGYQPSSNIINANTVLSSTETETHTQESSGIPFQKIDEIQVFIDTFSDRMKQQHSHEISSVLVQLSMADFRLFVLEQFPVKGESVFQQIMRAAFPNYADSIFALLESMRQYNEWHIDMLLTLNDMNPLTRKGTLWAKRTGLFGDRAQEIWQQELDGEENKQKNIQETLALLHQANELSMTDRLNILTDSINQQYGDEHSNLLISKGMVADIYFHLDSVQTDLEKMNETERINALAESRRQLGFTPERIKELAQQDQDNEIRWKNGYEYMSARDQVVSLYNGSEQDAKLTDLREKYFKHEAATIEKEEKTDFYRYKRPRLYGSN